MQQIIFGIDFDGTIVTHKFPAIGEPVPGALKTIRALKQNGHLLFLWTMRGYQDRFPMVLEEAKGFCRQNNIDFHGYNESPAQFSDSKKQYAQIYIDDAALGCPLKLWHDCQVVDWEKVARELFAMDAITRDQWEEIVNDIWRNQ